MNETEYPESSAPVEALSTQEREPPMSEELTSSPAFPQPKPFSAGRWEIFGALACYVLGWIWFDLDETAWLLVFTAGFIALVELLHRETPRPKESLIWLGCMLILTAALALERCNAWSYFTVGFFLHLFAVWWVLSRSGRLAENESGHLLPYDALHGFIVFPFKHFFLRIRCLWYGLTHLGADKKRVKTETVIWSVAAALAAVLLFARAVRLLTQADEGFGLLLAEVVSWFSFDSDSVDPLRLFFSLPVGAYLFGLIAGSAREDAGLIRERGASLTQWLVEQRKVLKTVFAAVLGVFCLFYLVFFSLQGSYLFGAFTRTLPDGFVVAEYARQGFFELCRVMALNFALLWLAARFAEKPLRESRLLRALAASLLCESLLFAVIAASKLALYIDCFGFTPLRLQAAWLVSLLSAGCVCALTTLFSGKKTFRGWMVFGAVTLCLLCLY